MADIYEASSVKELTSGDFALSLKIEKIEKGFRLARASLIVEDGNVSHVRALDPNAAFRMAVMNSPEVNPLLHYWKKEKRNSFDLKLEATDKLRKLIRELERYNNVI